MMQTREDLASWQRERERERERERRLGQEESGNSNNIILFCIQVT